MKRRLSDLERVQLIDMMRHAFEHPRYHHRTLRVTLEELVALFEDSSLTMRAISKRLSVSDGYVTRLYRQFGQPVIGYTARERRQWVTATRVDERMRDQASERVLFAVSEAAAEAGLDVRRVMDPERSERPHLRKLLIQGYYCKIHELRFSHQPNPKYRQRYAPFRIRVGQKHPCDVHIFYIATPEMPPQAPHRILIVPAFVLNRLPVRNGCVKGQIPTENLPRRSHCPVKIDWHRYENSWHFLDDSEDEEGDTAQRA